MIMRQVKIPLLVIKEFSKIYLEIFLIFWKINIIDKYQTELFLFSACFLIWLIWYQKNYFKLWISISRSNLRDGCNGVNHRWPGHTRWPTWNGSRMDGRKTPPCAEKNILETIKSFLISDYYKFVFLDTEVNNSCLMK